MGAYSFTLLSINLEFWPIIQRRMVSLNISNEEGNQGDMQNVQSEESETVENWQIYNHKLYLVRLELKCL